MLLSFLVHANRVEIIDASMNVAVRNPLWGPVTGHVNPGLIELSLKDVATSAQYQIVVYNYLDKGNIIRNASLDNSPIIAIKQGSISPILFHNLTYNGSVALTNYSVFDPGMYCVEWIFVKGFVSGSLTVNFKNSYGLLPSIFYPGLPFYKILSVVYLILGLLWMAGCFIYWKDILKMQLFISGVFVFLIFESVAHYFLFSHYNQNGQFSMFFMMLVLIANAARSSVSWFMILITALGYGVVRPSLGNEMYIAMGLTGVLFIADTVYSYISFTSDEDSNDNSVLFSSIPLAVAMTVFYMWIITGLSKTVKSLTDAKQNVKLAMYKNFTNIMGLCGVLLFIALFLNVFMVTKQEDESWIPYAWKWNWLSSNGVSEMIYLIIFVCLAFLWRPTNNNQRYGLSEVSQDDDLERSGDVINLQVVHGNKDVDEEEEDDVTVMKWVQENILDDQDEEKMEERAMADEEEVETLVNNER